MQLPPPLRASRAAGDAGSLIRICSEVQLLGCPRESPVRVTVAQLSYTQQDEVRLFDWAPLEGGAQWCATGLESRARFTPEGSTPSPSSNGPKSTGCGQASYKRREVGSTPTGPTKHPPPDVGRGFLNPVRSVRLRPGVLTASGGIGRRTGLKSRRECTPCWFESSLADGWGTSHAFEVKPRRGWCGRLQMQPMSHIAAASEPDG